MDWLAYPWGLVLLAVPPRAACLLASPARLWPPVLVCHHSDDVLPWFLRLILHLRRRGRRSPQGRHQQHHEKRLPRLLDPIVKCTGRVQAPPREGAGGGRGRRRIWPSTLVLGVLQEAVVLGVLGAAGVCGGSRRGSTRGGQRWICRQCGRWCVEGSRECVIC
jgi:hypothetical protein